MRIDQGSGPAGLPRVPATGWTTTSQPEERLEPRPRETLWFRVLAWLMMLLGVMYLWFVVPGTVSPDERLFGTMKALGLMVLSQFALMSMYSRLEDTVYVDGDVMELAHQVPEEATVAVRVTVCQAGVVTGVDHGWTWLEGGAVHFLGHGSAFRITRELVPPVGMWPRGEQPKHDILYGSVALVVPAEPFDVRIKMEALQPFATHETRQRASKYSRALRHWFAHHVPSEYEAVLPPTILHPALMTSRLYPNEARALGVAMGLTNLSLIAYALLGLATEGTDSLGHIMPLLVAGSMLALTWRFYLANRLVRKVRSSSLPAPAPEPTVDQARG